MNTKMSLLIISIITAASCAHRTFRDQEIQQYVTANSGPEFRPILFKSGRPWKTDILIDSMSSEAVGLEAVELDLKLIKQLPPMQLSIEGSTDGNECTGNICVALARRRAELVKKWFVERGVDKDTMRLAEPVEDKIRSANNQSVEEAQVLRSVQIWLSE